MAAQSCTSMQFRLRKQIAKRWPEFSDAELDGVGNNARQLVEALQHKFGLPRTDAEQQVRGVVRRAWQEWLAG